jgi:urea transport system ATP-binding protein
MLSIENLKVSYGQSNVIGGVSFHAKPGETVAIMGRNGMGKTTLMKSMIGILKSDSGSVKLGEEELASKDSFMRVRSGMSFVPQGRQIFSTLTVEQNIKTGLEARQGAKKIPEHLYETFPVLKEMRKRKGGNLSGGQQQQLAIARALASDPKVLLLDEPTEGIQPSIIKDMARTLNDIKEKHQLTIIVSEQVLSFALAIADRIIVIESGQFVRDEPREEVDEATVSKYLSV